MVKEYNFGWVGGGELSLEKSFLKLFPIAIAKDEWVAKVWELVGKGGAFKFPFLLIYPWLIIREGGGLFFKRLLTPIIQRNEEDKNGLIVIKVW